MAPLTLTELCGLIGEALEESLAPSYWVKAEISSLSERGGHMYLELVDAPSSRGRGTAKMRATCWAGNKEMLLAYCGCYGVDSSDGEMLLEYGYSLLKHSKSISYKSIFDFCNIAIILHILLKENGADCM